MGATRKNTAKKIDLRDDADVKRTGTMRPDEMPPDVIEFITAIDDYKRLRQRPFPTWSEILEILKGLGYQRSA
jgi:hypothetical protein